tara:strand:+ start:196 stop:717 length:522 start_codon:yes stop_codon:yes gene_type:complete
MIKNMRRGNKFLIIFIFSIVFNNSMSFGQDKILSSPLINLDELKPSFEEIDETSHIKTNSGGIKKKQKIFSGNNQPFAKFIGLDKITAKTSEIIINLGEIKKFGPLEIKVLKCGEFEENDKKDSVAYLQVKDLTENQNEKVFIFNGWTFASDPTIAPFDHAIYDLQLVNCNNV